MHPLRNQITYRFTDATDNHTGDFKTMPYINSMIDVRSSAILANWVITERNGSRDGRKSDGYHFIVVFIISGFRHTIGPTTGFRRMNFAKVVESHLEPYQTNHGTFSVYMRWNSHNKIYLMPLDGNAFSKDDNIFQFGYWHWRTVCEADP